MAFLDQALRSAELEAGIANADLAAFWTENVDSTLDLADALQNPPPPPAIAAAAAPYRYRPEFRLYNAEKEGFEADYRHQPSFLLPQLTVNLQYGIDAGRLSWQDRGQAAFFTLKFRFLIGCEPAAPSSNFACGRSRQT